MRLLLLCLALLLFGCAGGTASGPFTYRDALTCSEGLVWEQGSPTEPNPAGLGPNGPAVLFKVSCPGRAKWSGPPSPDEVSSSEAKLALILQLLGAATK
jgi:hypothetical protein